MAGVPAAYQRSSRSRLAEALRAFETERVDVGWLALPALAAPARLASRGQSSAGSCCAPVASCAVGSAGIAQQLMRPRSAGTIAGIRRDCAWGPGCWRDVGRRVPPAHGRARGPRARLGRGALATLLSSAAHPPGSPDPSGRVRTRSGKRPLPALARFRAASGPPGRPRAFAACGREPRACGSTASGHSFEPIDIARTLPPESSARSRRRHAPARVERPGSWQLGSVYVLPKSSS